jgi:hypothetical protein
LLHLRFYLTIFITNDYLVANVIHNCVGVYDFVHRFSMPPRKVRSDIKIGNLEKRLGLDKGAIRNPDGTDARSDKKLGTLRAEYQRLYGGPAVRAGSTGLPKKATASAAPKKVAAPKKAAAPKKVAPASKTTSRKK